MRLIFIVRSAGHPPAGVNAAAISKVMEPKGVVLLPTTQPDVIPKLSPALRFEKITPAFADAPIPAIRIPIAILIGPSLSEQHVRTKREDGGNF